MRLSHFEHFRPFCPVCSSAQHHSPISLRIQSTVDSHIIEGVLTCENPHCHCEFPIIDGIPILVPDPATYVAAQYASLTGRSDLSSTTRGMLIECQGAGQWDDAIRQHISGSAWDHWGEFDVNELDKQAPGSIARIVRASIRMLGASKFTSAIDVGCALGRSTFELARNSTGPVLGVEIHAGMIRRAAEILRTGRVCYDRRRCGMLYDYREFDVPVHDHASLVDFWIMNAAHPCIEDRTMGVVNVLNVLDCTPSPLDLLRATAGLVQMGGHLVIASPFDWSPSTTAVEAWIGGHSPRGYFSGSSEDILRSLLTDAAHPVSIPGFQVISEQRDVPWQVRMHERAIVRYSLQLIAAMRTG